MRRKRQREVVNLSARITHVRSNYYITRSAIEPPVVDDEATLEVRAIIEEIDSDYQQHIGEELAISLLSATRYDEPNNSTFDGSITLSGTQRTASPYLPPQPFWPIRGLISMDDVHVRLHFVPTSPGRGSLVGLYIEDRNMRSNLSGKRMGAQPG